MNRKVVFKSLLSTVKDIDNLTKFNSKNYYEPITFVIENRKKFYYFENRILEMIDLIIERNVSDDFLGEFLFQYMCRDIVDILDKDYTVFRISFKDLTKVKCAVVYTSLSIVQILMEHYYKSFDIGNKFKLKEIATYINANYKLNDESI